MVSDWIKDARRRLLDLRRGPGAWGYHSRSAPAVEPTALAGLALLATDADDRGEGRTVALSSSRWLASIRRPDGSLGVTVNLPDPGWPTPLAVLLWAATGGFALERSAAIRWILNLEGQTIPRVANDPLGHDTMVVGWPWVAGTHSWVEPSAMALLALGREGHDSHARTTEGIHLLRDRAIPGGGWNLGNPVVFGTTLRPLPGPTGLALLALARVDRPSKIIAPAVTYLRGALEGTLAPASLGWGLLGLRAWGTRTTDFSSRLASAFERMANRDSSAVDLALLLLAAGPSSLDLLGLPARSESTRHA